MGSLCTGILGLDLAVMQHFGADLAWYSEVEPAPITIIEREHPGVPNLGDLKLVDWSTVPAVDILTAGYPCQPFSHAGNRKGTDDPRHLWPFIADAIRHLRPRWVVLENVRGHLSLGFDEVLWTLAEAGFDAEWCVLRASDVGATHQRARLFMVATDACRERHGGGQDGRAVGRVDGRDEGEARERQRPRTFALDRGAEAPAHADCLHDDGRGDIGQGGRAQPANGDPAPTDAHGEGRVRESEQHGAQAGGLDRASRRHPDRRRLEDGGRTALGQDEPVEWGKYEPAVRRWEHVLGRPVPHPVDDKGRLNPDLAEWMMGYPDGWLDELPHGAALKAFGNSVMTQQALAALRELAPEAARIGAAA